jgi:hypothetical protein
MRLGFGFSRFSGSAAPIAARQYNVGLEAGGDALLEDGQNLILEEAP